MTNIAQKSLILMLNASSRVSRFVPFLREHDFILCYHDVGQKKWEFSISPKEFEKQIIYLKSRFTVVLASEIVQRSKNNKRTRVAITFDDGYEGVFEYALPILQRHGLVATVFVVGASDIRGQTGYDAKLMKQPQINKLRSLGWEIGWHTRSHKSLESLGERTLVNELKKPNSEYKLLAYPYGLFDHYVRDYAKKAGYEYAFSVDGKTLGDSNNKFAIPRVTVSHGIIGVNFQGLVSPLGIFINRSFTCLWRFVDNVFRSKARDSQIIISSYDDITNPHYGGGGAIAIHEMAKRISKNFKVKVISWNHSGITSEIIDGVYYQRIGFKSFNPKFAQVIFQLSLLFLATIQKYDLWLESFGPPLTTSFLPLIIKNKVIGVVHMLSSEEMERKYKLPFGLVEKIGLRTYTNIVATSEPLKSKILGLSPKSHVEVISNGVEKVSSPKGRRRKQILFLGRLEVEQKGLDLLIEGFKKFTSTEAGEGYKLVIAGNGTAAEFNKLKSLVREAGIRKSVVLLGRVQGKQKEKLFNSSSCMVVSSRFETFSMVALEAMAHGLPVVAFDIDGLLWTPKEAALKVPPFNTEALGAAIALACAKNKKSERLSKKGLTFAKKFTWDRIAARYEDYFGRIIYG